jgi:tetratricopeptide (TPR) repeat protein
VAYEYNRRAGAALEANGYGGTIDRLVTLNNEGIDLIAFGEVKTAVSLFADLVRRMDARGPSTRLSFHANYGLALTLLGRTDDAVNVLQATLARALATQNTVWENQIEYYLARALIQAGRFEEAGTALDRVEQVYRRDPAMNQNFLRGVALARSDLLLRSGQAAQARRVADALVSELGYPGTLTHAPSLAPILRQAAETALATGDPARAASLATASLEVAQKAARDVDRSADVGKAHLMLGRARLALRENTSGRAEVAAAIPGLTNGLGNEHPTTLEAQRLLQEALAQR